MSLRSQDAGSQRQAGARDPAVVSGDRADPLPRSPAACRSTWTRTCSMRACRTCCCSRWSRTRCATASRRARGLAGSTSARRRSHARLELEVQDSGDGLPPDRLNALNDGVGLSNTRARLAPSLWRVSRASRSPTARTADSRSRSAFRSIRPHSAPSNRAGGGRMTRRSTKIRALVVDDEPVARDRAGTAARAAGRHRAGGPMLERARNRHGDRAAVAGSRVSRRADA